MNPKPSKPTYAINGGVGKWHVGWCWKWNGTEPLAGRAVTRLAFQIKILALGSHLYNTTATRLHWFLTNAPNPVCCSCSTTSIHRWPLVKDSSAFSISESPATILQNVWTPLGIMALLRTDDLWSNKKKKNLPAESQGRGWLHFHISSLSLWWKSSFTRLPPWLNGHWLPEWAHPSNLFTQPPKSTHAGFLAPPQRKCIKVGWRIGILVSQWMSTAASLPAWGGERHFMAVKILA